MSKNRVIGINNTLPWHIPEDMKFFREKTKSKVMIMGRKTFESFGKPLPGRFHIIMTKQENFKFEDPNVQVVPDLKIALELAHMITSKYPAKFSDEVFIIGGGEIYQLTMDIVDRIYLTVIDKEYEGDAKFPVVSEKDFKLSSQKKCHQETPEEISYSFNTYERVK